MRFGVAAISRFIALAAIGGGLALLLGLAHERYPLDGLIGTPFTTPTIPALLLAVLVGGIAATALVLTVRARTFRPRWVATSGAILMGWIVGEVRILRPTRWNWIEVLYLGLGALRLLASLAHPAWRESLRSPRQGAS